MILKLTITGWSGDGSKPRGGGKGWVAFLVEKDSYQRLKREKTMELGHIWRRIKLCKGWISSEEREVLSPLAQDQNRGDIHSNGGLGEGEETKEKISRISMWFICGTPCHRIC